MGTKRKTYTDKFKAKVALEAVKGVKTLAELSSEYQVHSTQISEWKRMLLEASPDLFAGRRKRAAKTEEELTAPLYEEIGRLKMDIKWLEKNSEPAIFNSSGMDSAEPVLFDSSTVSVGRRSPFEFVV